jgi:hypothetical protein
VTVVTGVFVSVAEDSVPELGVAASDVEDSVVVIEFPFDTMVVLVVQPTVKTTKIAIKTNIHFFT